MIAIAQVTSVPGVVQRTGATVYYLVIIRPDPADFESPVLARMPVPGQVDVVIPADSMEAGRALLRGFVSAERTALITSTHRDYAYVEKAARTSAIVDPQVVLDVAQKSARRFVTLDARARQHRAQDSAQSAVFPT